MGAFLSQPNTNKVTESGQNSQFKFACSQMQGWRKNMQDAKIHQLDVKVEQKIYSIFAIFDGHGGPEVSKFVQSHFVEQLLKNKEFIKGNIEEALKLTFRKMDLIMLEEKGIRELNELRSKISGQTNYNDAEPISDATGCTANVIVIDDKNYYIANCGDSRSVLCRDGTAVALSFDHKPQQRKQRQRIQFAGGQITNGRVNGGLNLTRALGDFDYKKVNDLDYTKQMITCNPDVLTVQRTRKDQFIIMGCDGIWERYVQNNQGMIDDLSKQIKSKKQSTKILEDLLDRLLAKSTTQEMGCDNMTSILIEVKTS